MESNNSKYNFNSGYFKGINDLDIYYEKLDNKESKAAIVLVHGFCESVEKYHEIKTQLAKNNYSVYAIEHRGHGRSGRLGVDDSQVSIENFDYYIEDLKTFLDKVVTPETNGKKLFLFGHSMGGAISALFLEKYGSYFDAAILNAPMMEIDTGKYPMWVSKIIAKAACLTGNENKYVLGHGPFNSKPNLEASGSNYNKRYLEYFNKQLRSEKLQQSGPSYLWFKESVKATEELLKKDNIEKIKIPVLLIQAGRDTFVKPKGHRVFAETAENCELYRIEESKHEPFMEKDEIFETWIKKVLDFYKNNI